MQDLQPEEAVLVRPLEREAKLQLAISAEKISERVLVWKNILRYARADQRWRLVQEGE